jgi:hypothetical protein
LVLHVVNPRVGGHADHFEVLPVRLCADADPLTNRIPVWKHPCGERSRDDRDRRRPTIVAPSEVASHKHRDLERLEESGGNRIEHRADAIGRFPGHRRDHPRKAWASGRRQRNGSAVRSRQRFDPLDQRREVHGVIRTLFYSWPGRERCPRQLRRDETQIDVQHTLQAAHQQANVGQQHD